jgi:hypothetical protein
MAEWNTVKLKQIDALEFGAFVTGLITGGFSEFLTDYIENGGTFGNSLVYATDVAQTVSGSKTFVIPPTVSYTGTSGQVVAKRYIDDQLTAINVLLNPLAGSQFVYKSGDQTVSGNKTFAGTYTAVNYLARSGFGASAYGINVNNSALVNSSGTEVLNWETKLLDGVWSFNSLPLINGGYPVLTSTNQVITGEKTFTGNVLVKTATAAFNPVPFSQFQTALNLTGQTLENLLRLAASGSASGFGGVLSFNGISGNIFTQGRGTVTVWQQGNILNISGAELLTGDVSSVFSVNQYSFATGDAQYRVNFASTYSTVPFVFTQMGNSGVDSPVLGYHVSGVDLSGFSVLFSDEIANSGYFLNYFSFESSGALNFLRGEQGLIGPYLQPKGDWQTGTSYAYLDFVNINGISWASKTGHASITATHPTGVSGSVYWTLLASGTGPRGDNGIAFAYTGPWSSARTYASGEAVTYNGASYGFTGASSLNQAPTGSPWFVIAARGEAGLTYRGNYSTGLTYSGGDVVVHNHQTFTLPSGYTSTGLNQNPSSYHSNWEPLQDRAIVFNGNYNASRIYYKNDLAASTTGFSVANRVQYIWNRDEAILGLHPEGKYNAFSDCSGVTGYNLFELSVTNKNVYNPRFGQGANIDLGVNLNTRNNLGSGFDTLTLIRNEIYYFDNENAGTSFIIATSEIGGNFNDQYVSGISTGSRLLVGAGNYSAMGFNQALNSGSMRFAPTAGTPDDLYLCSPTGQYIGWHLKIVDSNPWLAFTSGVQGASGASGSQGIQGNPGLAFEWKGNWHVASGYNSGNAVYFNGSSYGTNQFVIGTAPGNAPWFLVASKGDDGEDAQGLAFVWKGTWNSLTSYEPNDSVYYLGSSYATTGAPPAGYTPVAHPEFWFYVARSGSIGQQGQPGTGIEFMWRGNFSTTRNYLSGDAVHYQGTSYVTTGTSSGILPSTGLTWGIVAQGGGVLFNWQGTWAANTTYHSGHAVYHSGSSYACFTTNYNDRPGTNGSVWSLVASKGEQGERGLQGPTGARGTGGLAFEWRGTWSSAQTYAPHDAVYFNGSSYGTLDTITGVLTSQIPANSSLWFPIAQKGDPGLAFTWRGNWSNSTLYSPYSAVYYSGRSYATLTYAASGFAPGSAPWFTIAEKGDVFVNQSHYFGNSVPTVGEAVWEAFIGKPTTVTGFVWAVNTQLTAGENISGSIYKRTLEGVKTNLFNFTITTGLSYYWSGNANKSIATMERLGIDLSGGIGANTAGLTVGIFGNAPSV